MLHQQEKRSDTEIQNAVRNQFIGIVPERRAELEELWKNYDLQFSLLADGDSVEIQGGLYRHVEFNHRFLRVIWIGSFAAWEAYSTFTKSVLSGKPCDHQRLKALLDCALEVQNSHDFLEIELPGIPEPGEFPDKENSPELRAASELAVFASGWAMLHEVRHVKHQQDGTSTTNQERIEKHNEEFSCDEFATKFILEKISDYAVSTNQNFSLVERKRKLGIYFAIFSLTILSKDNWNETETHPSLQDRINAICREMNGNEPDDAWIIAACAFLALRDIWGNSPMLSPI